MLRPRWLVLVFISIAAGCSSTGVALRDTPSEREPASKHVASGLSGSRNEPAGTAKVEKDRKRSDNGVVLAKGSEEGRVTPASAVSSRATDSRGLPELDEIDGAQIVATVNGAPIFASEVLSQHKLDLARAKLQASPEEYQQLRLRLIAAELPARIQNKVLVEAMKAPLKKEEWEQIQQQLKSVEDARVEEMLTESKAESVEQLAEIMARQGASLDAYLRDFRNMVLAQQYLKERAGLSTKTSISRQQLLAYYEQHREDYAQPARVRWQQIRVTFARHGGRAKAFEVLNQAVEELRRETDFGEVAKKYSDGPHAAEGGHWNWAQKGSLANSEIEKALFSLSVGQISQVYTFDDEFQIVRVVAREEAGYTSFEELQSEIRKKIEEEAQVEARRKVMKEILDAAVIETIFGNATPGQTASASN